MKRSIIHQRLVFGCVVLLLCALYIPRVWALRLLYLDSTVRMHVQRELTEVATEEGWLVSDIIVRSVSEDAVMILHRGHIRGRDPRACFVLPFRSELKRPCDV
ncbi:MAG: hypothetical protein Q7R81_01665 [Candidatus Peregrinibacteria bacterium]|nr:hypothetical protein [Candidatus Peregrinibacteria bacterium]